MEMFAFISTYLSVFYIDWDEICTIENKIQKNYCPRRKTPYNAPPLTDAELRHAAAGGEEKRK
ncbi:hypothetical protein Xvie_00450 [Xenorhabdus vietnamensis]|uniref:Uncharacterized protein n=1 Tax=Xenorhabdus vietnamensis TaxID=351656 RepID=A0A1Y2SJN3_9GAMM|nr:hypothetical protein Xvie_00450 [Xenorhabdus vietnamensis]